MSTGKEGMGSSESISYPLLGPAVGTMIGRSLSCIEELNMRPYSRDTVSEGTKGGKRDLGRKGVCRRKEEKGGEERIRVRQQGQS